MCRLWRSQVILILAGIVLQIQTSEYCHGAECQRELTKPFVDLRAFRGFGYTHNEETYNFNTISKGINENGYQSKMKKKRDNSKDSGVDSEIPDEEKLFVDFENPTKHSQPESSSSQPESSSPQPEKNKDKSGIIISEFLSVLKNMKFVFSLPLKIIFVNSPKEKVPPEKSTQPQQHAVDSCEIYT